MYSSERLYDVLRLVRPVHELSARAVSQYLEGTGLSMPARAILELLYDRGPQTVPQMARALFVTRQGVQALVEQCKTNELVTTASNPAHRRSHLIALTERGRDTYRQLHEAELTRLSRVSAALAPSDIDAAERVLQALVDGLVEMTTHKEQK